MSEETCPTCRHPYRSETPSPGPRVCVWCGAMIPAELRIDSWQQHHAWRAAMTGGALAVLLAGAIVVSTEWSGWARGTRTLMQGLTGVILAAVLGGIWWRHHQRRPA